jgi:CheY-like chemotaxis protein
MANILVADDYKVNRKVYKFFVEQFGHNVWEAEDGISTIAALQENDIDLVLLDIEMPRLNGFDVLVQLRELNIRVKIIVITAMMVSAEDAMKALSLGACDYLLKPPQRHDLKLAVDRALLSNKYNINADLVAGVVDDFIDLANKNEGDDASKRRIRNTITKYSNLITDLEKNDRNFKNLEKHYNNKIKELTAENAKKIETLQSKGKFYNRVFDLVTFFWSSYQLVR